MAQYLIMDSGRTVREVVQADSPREAKEKAKRFLKRGWIGELEVYIKEDPLKGEQREATQNFFGARPPIIL